MIPLTKKELAFIAGIAALNAVTQLVYAEETPSITLNAAGFEHACKLILESRVVLDGKGAWAGHRPSRGQENEFIRLHGLSEYAKWHLGINRRHGEETKEHYKFPFGDFAALHRCGLLAVKARAHQYGYAEIEAAADQLLRRIELRQPTR